MLKIYICEDDKKQLEQITKAVENTIMIEELDMKVELSTADPFEIIRHVENESGVGIYFLDVMLNSEIDGIELATRIRDYDPRGFIVFVTTHPELSYLTFKYKVEALDYVVKGKNENLEYSIRSCILNAYNKFLSNRKEVKKFFYAKFGQRIVHLPYEEIIYFETSSTPHKVIVYTINRRVEFYGHVGRIMKELDDRFYQCHKSIIINRDHIVMVDKGKREIHLTGDNICVASVRAIKGIYD